MTRLLVFWGYAVEILLSALVVLLLCMSVGTESLLTFLRTAALDIATLFGPVMPQAALAFLWTFFSIVDTPFYRWLDSNGAFQVYIQAVTYAVLISLLSTSSLVIYKHVDNAILGLAAAFFLALALINMYTLTMNVIGLMKLNALFLHR
jgi:hypothetical protein